MELSYTTDIAFVSDFSSSDDRRRLILWIVMFFTWLRRSFLIHLLLKSYCWQKFFPRSTLSCKAKRLFEPRGHFIFFFYIFFYIFIFQLKDVWRLQSVTSLEICFTLNKTQHRRLTAGDQKYMARFDPQRKYSRVLKAWQWRTAITRKNNSNKTKKTLLWSTNLRNK